MDVLNENEAKIMAEIAASADHPVLIMRGFEITKRNFELRKGLVDYAIIHRPDGENPPLTSS